MVIKLRQEANELTPAGEDIPFTELHSDIYESFFGHPSMVRYHDIIEMYFDLEEI